VERRVEGMSAELVSERSRGQDLEQVRQQLSELKGELGRTERERDELRTEFTQADTARRVLEPVREEVSRLHDANSRLEAQLVELQAQLELTAQRSADANADKEAAEWRLSEARKLEEAARARVRDAEADVAAARRERDQVRASVESRQTELTELELRLTSQRREFDELTQTRWELLDSEKQRAQKLRAELDQARAELARLRGSPLPGATTNVPQLSATTQPMNAVGVPTAALPPAQPMAASAPEQVEAREAAGDEPVLAERPSREQGAGDFAASEGEPDEFLEELDPLEIEEEVRERMESLDPAPAPARSIEAGIDAMLNADPGRTLPPRPPANDVQPAKPRRRRGETAYSVTKVDEEDVYGTGRMPKPGRSEGGGRGAR
jgi:uncharacterized coiled-coil DUF342 family protein